MDRRAFFRTMIGGVAATAAMRTWPFRVYSFPAEIVAPSFDQVVATTLEQIRADILVDNFFLDTPWLTMLKRKGDKINIATAGEMFKVPFRYDPV